MIYVSGLAVFEQLDAAPWARRARSELRASGETAPHRTTGLADQLTPQEFQIALQVAEGKTNREVGAALFLSPKTVDFHLSRTYRKLGIRSRAELVLGSSKRKPTRQPITQWWPEAPLRRSRERVRSPCARRLLCSDARATLGHSSASTIGASASPGPREGLVNRKGQS